MSKKKKIVGVVVGVVALIAVMAGLYLNFGPKTQEGAKAVTIEVVDDEGESTEYKLHTDAEYLVDAMEEAGKEGLTFSGTKGEFGLTVDTVNDVKADFNTDAAYWAFYVNGEYCNYGVDQQPVADGDAFKIEYTIMEEQ